jgi:hypothetical protein
MPAARVIAALRNTLAALAFLGAGGAAQAAIVAAEHGAFAGTTHISFDDIAVGSMLGTQYAALGVADFNASVLGSQANARTQNAGLFLLPGTVSGADMAYGGASIAFTGGVDHVGVWLYKGNGQHYLTALDGAQNVLLTVAEDLASSDSAFYDFVGVASDTKNIRYVVISNKNLSDDPTWDVNGMTTFYDDLVFSPIAAVPEPQTWVLMLLSLALVGITVRRRV